MGPSGVHNVPSIELRLFLVSSHPRDTLTHGHRSCLRCPARFAIRTGLPIYSWLQSRNWEGTLRIGQKVGLQVGGHLWPAHQVPVPALNSLAVMLASYLVCPVPQCSHLYNELNTSTLLIAGPFGRFKNSPLSSAQSGAWPMVGTQVHCLSILIIIRQQLKRRVPCLSID